MGFTTLSLEDELDDHQRTLREREDDVSLLKDDNIIWSHVYHPNILGGNGNHDGHQAPEVIVVDASPTREPIRINSNKRNHPRERVGAFIGMDGTIHSIGSESHTRRSTESTGRSSAPRFMYRYRSTNGYRKMEGDFDVSMTESVYQHHRGCQSCVNNCLFLTLITAVVIVGAIGGTFAYYAIRNFQETRSSSPAVQTTSNFNTVGLADGECRDGFIEERHAPYLALYMQGVNDLLNESRQRDLEEAVWLGYNNVSEGCGDRYHRWMYNIKMVDQTLVKNLVLEDANTTLETLFDGSPTLLAHFEMKISCKNCTEETAFASIYPKEFGRNITAAPRSDEKVKYGVDRTGKNRRRLHAGLLATSLDSTVLVLDALNAGDILLSMESFARITMLDLKAFHQAKIVSSENNGSVRTVSLQQVETENESRDDSEPTFFKNKIVCKTNHNRGCRK
jgi:hypothetical protein